MKRRILSAVLAVLVELLVILVGVWCCLDYIAGKNTPDTDSVVNPAKHNIEAVTDSDDGNGQVPDTEPQNQTPDSLSIGQGSASETGTQAVPSVSMAPLSHEDIAADTLSGRAGLTDVGMEAYDRWYAAASQRLDRVSVEDLGMSQDCFPQIRDAVRQDCSELFYVSGVSYTYYDDTGLISELVFSYREDADQSVAEAQAWRDGILASVPDSAKVSQAAVAVWLHDCLLRTVEYDLEAPDNQVLLSAMRGRTVCAGYSDAYSYLLHGAGIFAGYVTGQAGESHAWNVIRLDGQAGYADVTWDDQPTDDPATARKYFGLSAEEMACGSGHLLDSCRADLNSLPGCPDARAYALGAPLAG